MSEATSQEMPGFRGIAEEILEALADCFQLERLTVAMLGVALSLVAAAIFGVTAAILLLRNSLGAAALLAVIAGLVLYAGLLVTSGAISRLTMAERAGGSTSATKAFSFALWRSHILVGLPLFVLLMALAVGFAGGWLGNGLAVQPGIGAVLGPIAFIALFVLNLILICAVLLTHGLTGSCVACTDLPFAAVATRLTQILQERLHNFLGYQAAVLLAGLPLAVLTAAIFTGAFFPAFLALEARGGPAEVSAQRPSSPLTQRIRPEDIWGDENEATEEKPDGWIEGLRGWLQKDVTTSRAPLLAAAVIVALLLVLCPLSFAASAQSAVYLGLTGDVPVLGPEALPSVRGRAEAGTSKRPPIVHCWRCDAINRYQAETCSKCSAQLSVCPFCFSTNEPERPKCASCDKRLLPEEETEETEEAVEVEAD